jgi:hypothetical protein
MSGTDDWKAIHEEALAQLCAQVRSAVGLIAYRSEVDALVLAASRGLGADPLRTLRGVAGGLAMIDAALHLGCVAYQSRHLVTWNAREDDAGRHQWSARSRHASARLTAGVAYPILSNSIAVGVIAAFGRDAIVHALTNRRLATIADGLSAHVRAYRPKT